MVPRRSLLESHSVQSRSEVDRSEWIRIGFTGLRPSIITTREVVFLEVAIVKSSNCMQSQDEAG